MVLPLGSSNLSIVLMLAIMETPYARMRIRMKPANSPDRMGMLKNPAQSLGLPNFPIGVSEN